MDTVRVGQSGEQGQIRRSPEASESRCDEATHHLRQIRWVRYVLARGIDVKLIAAGVTNVGMKRAHNEDNHILVPEENLYVVADGMGGHASGEVASEIAVNSVADFFKMTTADDEQITCQHSPDRCGTSMTGQPPDSRCSRTGWCRRSEVT